MRLAACACILAFACIDAGAQTKPSAFQCPDGAQLMVQIQLVVPGKTTKFAGVRKAYMAPDVTVGFNAAQIMPDHSIWCTYFVQVSQKTEAIELIAQGLPPACTTAKALGPAWEPTNYPPGLLCRGTPQACAPPC
jgi:hypothetical protein